MSSLILSGGDAYVLSGRKSMHIVKRPNHTTWDLSRFGSIVRLVNERSTLEFFLLGATFHRLILWDELHNRQYLINTQYRFLFAKL